MTKRLSKLMLVILIGALFVTACATKDKNTLEEPVSEEVKNEEEVEEELTEEEIKEQEERNKKVGVYSRALDLVDEILEGFEGVEMTDERIQLTDDNESIYTADIHLYLDNDNKDEAVELIEKYSEIFNEKFTSEEDYEELIIYWSTPNHSDEEIIEKIYY